MNYIVVGFSLTATNFLYQTFTSHDYAVALDRSWFQVTALFAAWLVTRLYYSPTPQESE
jgi:hypothetical protein